MRRLLPLALPFLGLLAACASDGAQQFAPPPTPSPVVAAAVASPASEGGAPLYIALGDSLSEGVGALDSRRGFVSLVADGLDLPLLNLGHSGDTTEQLFAHGHVEAAMAEITARNSDDDEGNDVELVTLDIGGNDLLALYFSLVVTGVCPTVVESLDEPRCVDALSLTLYLFEANFGGALDLLLTADPDLNLVVMTLYNPFSGRESGVDALADLALEGGEAPFDEGMNDIIKRAADQRGVAVVDWYPLFLGKAEEYIYYDLIHPNDEGYRVMAEAVLAAVR